MSRDKHFREGLGDFDVVGHVHLPPTPEAVERIHQAQSDHRLREFSDEVERKDNAVKAARARNGPYGAGGHKATQRHLMMKHGAWREDVEEHDSSDLARWHESWHKDMKNWGNEDHTHG